MKGSSARQRIVCLRIGLVWRPPNPAHVISLRERLGRLRKEVAFVQNLRGNGDRRPERAGGVPCGVLLVSVALSRLPLTG